ncbi:MAG: hypothetical protein R2828_19310 [Saprospiraceae bacterium]
MQFHRTILGSYLLFFFLLSSCINSQSNALSEEEMLLTIANDETFKDYRKWVLKSARLVALKEVDFEALDQILNNNPSLESLDLCDEQLKIALSPLYGGDIYWETHCHIATLSKELEEKFKFKRLSDEQIKKTFSLAQASDALSDELARDILNQKENER